MVEMTAGDWYIFFGLLVLLFIAWYGMNKDIDKRDGQG